MKIKLFYLVVLASALAGCSTRSYRTGRVKASHDKTLEGPPGMVYVPSGSVLIGQPELDSSFTDSSTFKKVSLSAFYMDKTEVSNKQYRQFVNWVRDSIAVTAYIKDKSFFLPNKNGDSIANINWRKITDGKAIWKSTNNNIREKLRGMYYTGKAKRTGANEINVALLNYNYEYLNPDYTEKNGNVERVIREPINVYPDTTVWARDFPNSQNSQMTESYFSNPVYDDYPVVGVSWKQARAFAAWRTKIWRKYVHTLLSPKLIQLQIDLPTEAQWAYAATEQIGIIDTTKKVRNKSKTTLPIANYKQEEGDYTEDGAVYTAPVTSYAPNKFGLYNMAGNVAEWTMNYYTLSATAFISDLNPVLTYNAKENDAPEMKKKVVMGGCWKDIRFFVKPTTRTFEFQDAPKSYIGFRCVMPAPEILISEKTRTRN
ncbi:SUMF1/EgtB/PvdO family nonheme iron enzyme [Mucilaginibacter sp. UYCu711]|uniref:type IX secretion system lipoprotein PorK/GldK n=1 Tax=Mucilaginibacter sp. UYCu711 TaxID=3156339 RepID=UPI003D1D54A6